MIQVGDLCAYFRSAIGGGYCYGASGEVSSLARRRQWAEWNPSQAGNLLGLCAKWDGKRVWDCSGLFRGAYRELATYASGGATTIFNTWLIESGKIETMPMERGIAVFRGTEKTKEHIGLYVGEGRVVDARSASKGVLLGALGSYAWTHWGRLRGVQYTGSERLEEEALYLAEVVLVKKGLNLRTQPVLADNTIKLLALGEVTEVLSDDCGDGFARVRHGGVKGYCTRSYLRRIGTGVRDEVEGK